MKDILHIYTRVSSSAQEEGTSLDTQKSLGIKKSIELGFGYELFDEGGQSSSNDDLLNRPVLTELLRKIDSGEVKHLFVYNTDRLSRNPITWATIKLKIHKNDVKLYTPTGIYDSTSPTDNLLLGILSEISSYDNKLRADRTRTGKFAKIKQGFWLGGPPPFGYKIQNKKLVSDEYESKWVKFVFEMFSTKKTSREIRNELLINAVKTRRNNPVWSSGSIEKLLTNTHYIGYYDVTDKSTGETIRCQCESIISKDLWHQVEQLRELRGERRFKEPNQVNFHLLRDFLICGDCGSRMFAVKVKTSRRQVYYCPSRKKDTVDVFLEKRRHCKSSGYIKEDLTNELVWKTVIDVLTNSKQFKEETKLQILDKTVTHSNTKTQLSKLLKQIKKCDVDLKDFRNGRQTTLNQIDVVKRFGTDQEVESYEGIIKTIDNEINVVESKKQNLLSQISQLEESINWTDWLIEHKKKIKTLEGLTEEEKHMVLSKVIETIKVNKIDKKTTELEINFKLAYVNDQLIWNNNKDKSKGYTIQTGQKERRVVLTDEKKFMRNQ